MNSIEARENFMVAAHIFFNAFKGRMGWTSVSQAIEQFKLTQSELRLEQPLVANRNQYTFQVQDNQPGAGGVIFNTEMRLRMQDTFVPTHYSISLGNPSAIDDTTFRLYSYPNQIVFGAQAIQMRALYNGQLSLNLNNYDFVYNWGLQRHWYTPQTQQTAAFGAGSPDDQVDWSKDTFFPANPYVILGGSASVLPQIILPVAPTAVTAFSRYVLRMYGVNAQTSTPVQ